MASQGAFGNENWLPAVMSRLGPAQERGLQRGERETRVVPAVKGAPTLILDHERPGTLTLHASGRDFLVQREHALETSPQFDGTSARFERAAPGLDVAFFALEDR